MLCVVTVHETGVWLCIVSSIYLFIHMQYVCVSSATIAHAVMVRTETFETLLPNHKSFDWICPANKCSILKIHYFHYVSWLYSYYWNLKWFWSIQYKQDAANYTDSQNACIWAPCVDSICHPLHSHLTQNYFFDI